MELSSDPPVLSSSSASRFLFGAPHLACPRSPPHAEAVNETHDNPNMTDLSGIFKMKSPLSVLATDMDANLSINLAG
jgi:hypothetical protein